MSNSKLLSEELNTNPASSSEHQESSEAIALKYGSSDFASSSKRKEKVNKAKNTIVKVQKLPGAKLPEAKTKEAAGYDLCANNNFPVIIRPGEFKAIPTGLKMEIPEGWCAEVYSRSGLAAKNGMFVLNCPGLLDSDYRGEIIVILANFGLHEFEVKRGDRIAQLRVKKLDSFVFEEVESLSETERGEQGLGSTGV